MENDNPKFVETQAFLKELGRYQVLARERFEAFLNGPYSDATFEQRTIFEMLIEISKRLKALEKLMEPADEHIGGDDEKKGPRFTLAD